MASFVAFALAGAADALGYHKLVRIPRLAKVNGSNLASAAVDSIAFPALAFGFPLQVGVMAGQFIAKVIGGSLWSVVLGWNQSMRIQRGQSRIGDWLLNRRDAGEWWEFTPKQFLTFWAHRALGRV